MHPDQIKPEALDHERTPSKDTADCDLPENCQEKLDERLDHAIYESFPTSDPVSVVITK
jgi:hypothetical protein